MSKEKLSAEEWLDKNPIVPVRGNLEYCARIERLNGSIRADIIQALGRYASHVTEQLQRERDEWKDRATNVVKGLTPKPEK